MYFDVKEVKWEEEHRHPADRQRRRIPTLPTYKVESGKVKARIDTRAADGCINGCIYCGDCGYRDVCYLLT
jgi:DNA repair photolyase